MTRNWTEEKIAALVDGSLEDDAEAEDLRKTLETDPEAKTYAARVRRSNSLLREAFDVSAAEPVPAGIDDAIFGGRGNVSVLRPRRAVHNWMPVALAASIALVIGLGIGDFFSEPRDQHIATLGDAPVDGPLHAALETLPSGSKSEEGVQSILSFYDGAGRPCREFELMGDVPDELQIGVACRTPGGRWHVEIIVAAAASEPGSEGYVTASGPAGSALDAMLDSLEAGPPISPEAEATLLDGNWRKPE